ncbi:hypothetical protein VTI74DRAFT_11178 [Chaetomium olivicolor]
MVATTAFANPMPGHAREARDPPATPQHRDFARQNSYTPSENFPPTPSSTQGDIPLLAGDGAQPVLNPPGSCSHCHHEANERQLSWWARLPRQVNEVLLGREKASLYLYASLLAVLAALVVTFSTIFGWPPLPLWDYLKHLGRRF